MSSFPMELCKVFLEGYVFCVITFEWLSEIGIKCFYIENKRMYKPYYY